VNESELNFGFNKFIRVKGDTTTGVIDPLNKPVVHSQVNWIMDLLDQSAQRAVATPELQQGIPSKQQRTLGELELISSKVDTRFSLGVKIFGWSEKEFWKQWYRLYQRHFKEKIDEKIIRVAGIWSPGFRSLKRENIITKSDPDIDIESKNVSDIKRARERAGFVNLFSLIVNDPQVNRREAEKYLAKLNGLKNNLIKVIFPPTIDEIRAEEENDEMKNKKVPRVLITDDDYAHLIIHSTAEESKEREKHIKIHYEALKVKKANAQLFEGFGLGRGETPPELVKASISASRRGEGERPARSPERSPAPPAPAPAPAR
jgi:hypothetical protein